MRDFGIPPQFVQCYTAGMEAKFPRPCWYRLTPGWLVLDLLVAEALLCLSDRLGWPVWHKGYAVLTGMAAFAVVLPLPEPWVMFGALSFMLSDTLLAMGKFKDPVPGAAWIIWPTYYLGQLGIAIGFLRSKGFKM